MSLYTIQNSCFCAQVDPWGAQLVSLTSQGKELLWTGDPVYWKEHAPVLFPIVGALRKGRARIGGQWYEMGRHGFAKGSRFTLDGQTDRSVSLTLRADEASKRQYPFDFTLTVSYGLQEDGIRTAFTVANAGSVPMPFAIGGHPGFNIPLEEGATFEDYVIQFEQPENQVCPTVHMDTGLLDYEQSGFRLEGREIPLRHSLFYQDALVFSGLRSHCVRIWNPNSGKGVEMDFTGFPMLGIWSAPNDGPYVCLEPWTGCATLTTEGDDLEAKRGMAVLQPGQQARHSFMVKIL